MRLHGPRLKTKSRYLKVLFFSLFSVPMFAQTPIVFSPGASGQTFNTCNGFIIDSGDQGGPGYSNNESSVITLCPDTPGEIISVVFNLFDLDLTDDNPAPNATNVDYMSVYDGTSTAANSLGTYSGNDLQGVVIEATQLNTSGCITLAFTSNTIGTGMFTASVSCETPCNNPIAGGLIVDGLTNDSITVCVGEEVNFQEQGSFAQMGFNLVDYTWDFMDGNSASGQNVSHTYDAPGLYTVQLFVTDDNDCGNPNLIDLQVVVATIPDFSTFPQDTSICLGSSLSFSADPQAYEVEWSGFPGSESIDDGCLPDTLLGVSQDIELLQTGFSAGSEITDVSDIQSICFDLEHSYMGDLVILIECPNGQSTILHQQGGGGTQIGVPNPSDNVDCSDPSTLGEPFTYCFTNDATETWVEWVANNNFTNTIPAGDYEPIEPLSNLIGCPANGVWTLTVIDNWAADDGTLFSFGLNLDPSFYPEEQAFQPQIGNNADSSFWSTPATGQVDLSTDGNTLDLLPTEAGTFNYTYSVIDNFGCQNSASVNLTVEPNPIVFAGNDTTLCNGSTLQLQGAISGPGSETDCAYELVLEDTFGDGWNGNTITITIDGVATDYTLDVGASQTTPITLPSGQEVSVTFNANGSYVSECQFSLINQDGTVVLTQGPNLSGVTNDIIVPDCAPDLVIEWSPSGSLSDANILNPEMTLDGSTLLTLSVYPVGFPACVATDEVEINLSANSYAGTDGAVSFCSAGTPADLFPQLGASADPSGSWFDPNGNPTSMPFDPQTMPFGVYMYVVDASGCLDTAFVTVSVDASAITSINSSIVSCNGLADGSITVIGENIDFYSINGGAFIPETSPIEITGLTAGNYTIEVNSDDGCTDNETIEVSEPEILTLSAAATNASCFGLCDGQVQLTATGGTPNYTYNWSPGVIGNQAGSSTTLCAGTYSVGVTDENDCSAETNYLIEEPVNVFVSVNVDVTSGCAPHLANFTNTTSADAVVSTFVDYGDNTTESIVGLGAFNHIYEAPGFYDVAVTITTASGCSYTEVFNQLIEVYNNPTAGFYVNPNNISSLEPNTNFYNSSSPDVVSFLWNIYGGSPSGSTDENVENVSFPIGAPGDYPIGLVVTNAEGCMDSIQGTVRIVNDVVLYAPNTFTPDADEHNQTWEFYLSGVDPYDFKVQIFNRWGELIWESRDLSASWDGTYNGKTVASGMYTWSMKCVNTVDNEHLNYYGHINVIR